MLFRTNSSADLYLSKRNDRDGHLPCDHWHPPKADRGRRDSRLDCWSNHHSARLPVRLVRILDHLWVLLPQRDPQVLAARKVLCIGTVYRLCIWLHLPVLLPHCSPEHQLEVLHHKRMLESAFLARYLLCVY